MEQKQLQRHTLTNGQRLQRHTLTNGQRTTPEFLTGKRTTSERITSLEPNEIFVFGSNLKGMHGGVETIRPYVDEFIKKPARIMLCQDNIK